MFAGSGVHQSIRRSSMCSLPPDVSVRLRSINAGRRLLSIYPHAAIAPALALLTLVLGLNLLADGLREESLKD